MGCRIQQIFTHADHLTESKFPYNCNHGQIFDIIDQRHPFDLIMDETVFVMEKAGNDVIFIQVVKMLLNSSFIHRFGGSDRDLFTVYGHGFFQVYRINPMNRFIQRPLGA